MSMSTISQLREQLQQELQQLQCSILQYLQQNHGSEYLTLYQQLQQQPAVHWPELLRYWLTPELEQKSHRLELVLAALSQMDIGLYGLCSDCEARIGRELLQQDPARQRCASCEQRRHDNKNRGAG